MRRIALLCVLLASTFYAASKQRYQVTGMVLSVDAVHQSVLVSHDRIEGYMEAMTMPYRVDDPRVLKDLKPGAKIEFTLVVNRTSSYISNIHVRDYQSEERDPMQAARLKVLDEAMRSKNASQSALRIGDVVPDFSLLDQRAQTITLSELRGKVVAITFIYTRCPLPDFCFRMSTNFSRLQKRFADRMSKDLVLLSISFDPEHDSTEVLAKYAETWNANVAGWHFLTGDLSTVKKICARFGMNFWPDEGLFTHSLHTAVIDRAGKLVANVEGNQFSAVQLGDLVQATLTAH